MTSRSSRQVHCCRTGVHDKWACRVARDDSVGFFIRLEGFCFVCRDSLVRGVDPLALLGIEDVVVSQYRDADLFSALFVFRGCLLPEHDTHLATDPGGSGATLARSLGCFCVAPGGGLSGRSVRSSGPERTPPNTKYEGVEPEILCPRNRAVGCAVPDHPPGTRCESRTNLSKPESVEAQSQKGL